MTTKLERQDSVISILSSGIDLCRICHCDSSCGELISPCYCSGSMRFVHQSCLQHWIRASNNKACELCRYPYAMRTRLKPLLEWESLPMSASEKRRLFCSAIFHLIALACVIWSLYVLIDRSIEEVYQSELEWQFWTKIVVEAIGCLGAGVLIYVWGKSYFSIINKWIAFNRTFIVVSSSPPPIKKPMPASTASGTASAAAMPPCKTAKRPPPPPPPPHPPALTSPTTTMSTAPHPQLNSEQEQVGGGGAASCSNSSSPLMVESHSQSGGGGWGYGSGTFPCGGDGGSISDHENGHHNDQGGSEDPAGIMAIVSGGAAQNDDDKGGYHLECTDGGGGDNEDDKMREEEAKALLPICSPSNSNPQDCKKL